MAGSYNKPFLPGVFPDSLRKLYFTEEARMCSKIGTGVLPLHLTKLILKTYNHPLSIGVLPASLIYLRFGTFNQPLVPGVLPPNLETLYFARFDQDLVPGVLPPSLASITFGVEFCRILTPGVLPKNLKYIEFKNLGFDHDPLADGSLPNVTILRYRSFRLQPLPKTITNLRFGTPGSLGMYKFPPNLVSLHLDCLSLDDTMLPTSLTKVVFGDRMQSSVMRMLPNNLRCLHLGDLFNECITDLPQNLTKLVFGCRFNQLLEVGTLPGGLKCLKFGFFFNQPLKVGVLPSSLTKLNLGMHFNQPLEQGVLPSRLLYLKLPMSFTRVLVLPNADCRARYRYF